MARGLVLMAGALLAALPPSGARADDACNEESWFCEEAPAPEPTEEPEPEP
jgi:hypothetical protein